MDEQRVRRRVILHGRVQGVFFRDWLRQRAEQRHVAGWAANRPDGTVEAVFEGAADAVQRLLDYCRSGPPQARVDRIEVRQEAPQSLSDFRVR